MNIHNARAPYTALPRQRNHPIGSSNEAKIVITISYRLCWLATDFAEVTAAAAASELYNDRSDKYPSKVQVEQSSDGDAVSVRPVCISAQPPSFATDDFARASVNQSPCEHTKSARSLLPASKRQSRISRCWTTRAADRD